jgi:lipoprotein-releasing system permease protein
MALPFSLFLALKYLKPKRTFLSVVTVISILGVMLGVAVLIIVLSVMSGFDEMWRDKILGFNAHITITGYGIIEDEEELAGKIARIDQVTGVAPFVQGLVFVQFHDRVYTPMVRGVDPVREATVSKIPENMASGKYSVEENDVVIGKDLAARLGVAVGDKLLVYSPRNFMNSEEVHLPEELTVAGVFEIGMWEFDMGFIITSLDKARELYGMEQGCHAIQVMTKDPYHPDETAAKIRAVIGPNYDVSTWMQLNRQLFAALRVEKNMMFFLLIFITVVAAFGITNTLITVAVQKTREIGLLKALGFGSGSIMRVFFWQGWIEGVIGTIAGIGVGLLILRYRNDLMGFLNSRFRLELFPKELYHLSEIPAVISWSDISVIAVSVMIICTLAGLVPAYRAARLDPVSALRYE